MRYHAVYSLAALAASLVLALSLGCGTAELSDSSSERAASAPTEPGAGADFGGDRLGSPSAPSTVEPMGEAPTDNAPTDDAPQGEPAADEAELPAGDSPAVAPIVRKVIYTAEVSTVVEDFAPFPQQIPELAAKHGGYIASTTIHGTSGTPRSGLWTVRIPVKTYGAFVDEVAALGELENRQENSQEVTAEYYDIEARIRNKQQEEQRLLKHLDESTGKLEEILQVERELSRVREEIERMEGRIRVLRDQTSLSTVTIRIREVKGYVPPAAATFGTRVGRAWSQSLGKLAEAGQSAVVGIVAAAPWLVTLGVPLSILLVVVRRSRRRRG